MKDPAESRRPRWSAAYQALGEAGSICRRFGISRPTLRKWLRGYEAEGEAGLHDHSRRPHRCPRLKVDKRQEGQIIALRRKRRLGVITITTGTAPTKPAWADAERPGSPIG